MKNSRCRSEAKAASRELWKFRDDDVKSNWNAKYKSWYEDQWGWKSNSRKNKQQHVSSQNSELVTAPEKLCDIAVPYDCKIYGDSPESVQCVEDTMSILREADSGEIMPYVVTTSLVAEALDGLRNNEAAGKDLVQAEFMKKLRCEDVEVLRSLCSDRIAGGEKPGSWNEQCTLILHICFELYVDSPRSAT